MAEIEPTAEWMIWFDESLPRGLTLEEYRQRVRTVGKVKNLNNLVEKYAMVNNFSFIPEEESVLTGVGRTNFRFNLRIFRIEKKPFWEDQEEGTIIYTLKMPPSLPPVDFQVFWKALSRSVVSGVVFASESLVDEDVDVSKKPSFDSSSITGIVVHYGRNKGFGQVEIWCSKDDQQLMELITTTIIPLKKYGYEISSKTNDVAVNNNLSIRMTHSGPVNKTGMRAAFTKPPITTSSFEPYSGGGSSQRLPVRTFEKPSHLGDSQQSNAKVVIETIRKGKKGGRGRGGKGFKR